MYNANRPSTKERFLTEVKNLMASYGIRVYSKECNGVPPNDNANNHPNRCITGFSLPIPNEDMSVDISAKEFLEYMIK